MEFLKWLFTSGDFMPHGYCYRWVSGLVWLNVISDSLIFLAYMSIPFTLIHIARRRKDLPFNWIFMCFGVFIVACGVTHALEVWNLWHAMYWLAGTVKAVTAVFSIATAVLLVQLAPQALKYPSVDALQKANEALRSQAEAVRVSEIKFRGILESAPDGMVIADGRGHIVLVNAETERLFGYGREELVGQLVDMLVPERFREKHPHHREGYTAHPRTRTMGEGRDLRGLRKDNTEFPVEISLSPLESAEGILVTAAIRDISVRKAAASRLAEMARELSIKHRLLDSIVEGTTDLIYVRDLEHRFTLVNGPCAKVLRRSVNEVVGRSLRDLLPSDSYDAVAKSDQEMVRTGVSCTVEETVVLDGITRLFLTTKSPYHDADGRVIGTVGISREITERKKAEELLVKTVGELKRSNDELQQFAHVASHDLQEPLRMVASYMQLLAKRYKGRLDADADEFIAYAVDGSNRMQGLIQDLLAYSRAGTSARPLCEISTEKALNQALSNLRATIQESGAAVTHDALPVMTTDDAQLALVFQNLVGNALKYHGPEVPQVHVSASKNGDKEWIFSVRDNGLGIDPQYFARIFVLFQRLHGREKFEGTGIGLAICKKIVERLGGRIWVESRPEKGSTFYFALPERDEKVESIGTDASAVQVL